MGLPVSLQSACVIPACAAKAVALIPIRSRLRAAQTHAASFYWGAVRVLPGYRGLTGNRKRRCGEREDEDEAAGADHRDLSLTMNSRIALIDDVIVPQNGRRQRAIPCLPKEGASVSLGAR